MTMTQPKETGIRLGLIILSLVAFGFLSLFLFGPDRTPKQQIVDAPQVPPGLLDVLDDGATRTAIEALKSSAPATYAELDLAAKQAISDGETTDALSQLVLEALFAQFSDQALSMRTARSADYQAIITQFAAGLRDLKAANSPWCDGDHIAAYLAQNEEDLVPNLLAEFPYASPQYDWAMAWMTTILNAAKSAREKPNRRPRPTPRDEVILQANGINLGAEQWGLALQVAAFANSEGISYAKMQEVIASMNVCDLGIAAETVSLRLPDDVRARIWGDLIPEIMIGNTPYVMWRVTDYFFID